MHGGDDSEANSPRSSTKSLEAPDIEGTKEEASKLCGYLSKIVGKGPLRGFKSRWFVYDTRTCYLYYFKSPQDALPLGHIEIADASFCYDVEGEEGQFEIHTSGKEFLLKAQNAQVMRVLVAAAAADALGVLGLVARGTETFAQEKHSETMEKVRSDFAVETSAEGQVGVHTARSPTANINRSFRQWGTELRNSMSHFRPGRGGESRRSVFYRGRSDEWDMMDSPEHGVPQDSPRKPASETHKNSTSSAFAFDLSRSSLRSRRPFLRDTSVSGRLDRSVDVAASECNGSKASEIELRLQSQEEELVLLREEMANYKELVRVLQQSLKGPQRGRSPVPAMPSDLRDMPKNMCRGHPDTPTGPLDMPTEPRDTSETLREEDGQVRALRGHLEKLAGEKAVVQDEVDALRSRVGEISEQLAMLMETIQAKDRVIMQLSQQGGTMPTADCSPPTSTAQELQELDRLRDSLQGYKSQNNFLNKEILELSVLRRNAESREKALEAKYTSLEAKLCQVESKYLVLLQEVRNPVCSSSEQSPAREVICRLLEDALQVDSKEEENPIFKPHPVSEYDVYGFKTVPEDDEEERLVAKARALDLRSLSLTEQEVSVGVRWENYLAGTVTREMVRSPELKALMRSGVPHEHRSKVWRWCVVFHTRKFRESTTPGYYEGLLTKAREKQNPASKQIELDLMRTLPNNKHYSCPTSEGVQKLRNILLAFSWRNHDIGYCQGLNRLAAIALLYLEEENAFWCLVTIVEVFMPRDYYTKTLLGSQVDQRVLKDLMCEKLPRLHAHFELHKVDFSLITFNWFLVVFVDNVVSDILFKIWDAFLYEGPKIIFRFALALFKYSEEDFLKLQDSTTIFKYLRYFSHNILDSRKLMALAFQGMNSFPLRLIRNRQTFHLERVRLELTELEAIRQTFLRERETMLHDRALLSDDDEDN
ncbi:hypothetical protein SKAU_G00409650 [Synaphobranchus kaupii]|uniref:Rab-GAP TBC domain-containing protein n=1 Tax=Synaphobranchus kaupii TaxID=118154 RepID=A0A9Q1IBL8_SYNKA|nr:hypothetical protein SKAU_G00409650 [Synaphobranchus kaupii]